MFLEIINDEEFADLVQEHKRVLREDRGPTSTFWISCLDMMNILFAHNRATKLGDWELHLETTFKMIPWFFAYDRQNYSRYLTFYWAEMVQLQRTHPNIYREFM